MVAEERELTLPIASSTWGIGSNFWNPDDYFLAFDFLLGKTLLLTC